MKVQKVIITPQLALDMLQKNTNNRPLNALHVKKLAEEMSSDRWKFNGTTISMNGERLIDGQHRLHACIQANRPFETLLVEGLASDVFDTIDTGRKRQASDVLAIKGEKNARSLASALVFVHQYMTGTITANPKYTNTKIEELLEKYQGIRDSVDFERKYTMKGIIPPAVFVGCHYLFSQKDKTLADLFCDALIKGSNLQEGSPVYLLRERLIENTLSKAKLNRPTIAALTIKAWNHTRKGDSIRYLRWRTNGPNAESFPLVQ